MTFFSDLKLLPENAEDVRMASLLRLVPASSNPDEKRTKIENESIFSSSNGKNSTASTSFSGKLKSLQESISSSKNNFSSPRSSSSSSSGNSVKRRDVGLKIGVKRKMMIRYISFCIVVNLNPGVYRGLK